MTQLLERERVLQDLDGQLGQAARGHGRLVLVHGEAGVGKTTVLRHFSQKARSQARVLIGACDPLSTPRPLGPLVDIGPGLGPALEEALAQALAGIGQVSGVFRSVLNELGRRVSLLVVEDVHWADEATLDLLRYLARRLEAISALLVVTFRDDQLGPTHPLAILLGDLAAYPAVHQCAIAPLSRPAVAELAAGTEVDVEELYRITAGNPFFVTEILAAGVKQMPTTVQAAVLGRLARLSAASRALVEAVAVIGTNVQLELLTAVVTDAEAALEKALACGVLCAEGSGIGFRHELARRAVLEAIPAYRRIQWHRRVLAALRTAPTAPDALARLAHHSEQAQDAEAVLEFAPAAATHAAALGAYRQAAAHYAQALRYGDSLLPEQRAALLEGQAYACFVIHQLSEAIASLQAALELRRQLGERLREGDILQLLSQMLYPLGRTRQAKQAALDAVRVLETLEPSRELAWAYVQLVRLAFLTQDPAAATTYAQRAVALGERFGEPGLIVQAHFHAATTRTYCTGQGWEELEEMARRADEQGLADPVIMGWSLAGIAMMHRDFPHAFAAVERAEAYCLDHELLSYLLMVRGLRALTLAYQGQWDQAVQVAGEVLAHPNLHLFTRLFPLGAVGLVRARRGEPEVWPPLDEALTQIEPDDLLWMGPVRAARAEAAWLTGDDARALTEAHAGLAAVRPHSSPWQAGELAIWVQRTGGQPPTVPAAEPYALELAGDWAAAAECWERLGCAYDAALVRLVYGDGPALYQALAAFEALGAAPAATRTRERLRTLGLSRATRGPKPATRANPYGLTTREMEILQLLGEGLSDAQIAARLVISAKTAGHHVTAILAKLGVHTRQEAARALEHTGQATR